MTSDTKSKKSSTHKRARAMKAGSTPIPMGPGSSSTCDHSGCGSVCRVRHVGQTTRLSDHYVFHTARAVTNIWAAAIVVGLAIVLTGAVAYTSVSAKSQGENLQARREGLAVRSENVRLVKQIEAIQKSLQEIRTLCLPGGESGSSTAAVKKTTTKTKTP